MAFGLAHRREACPAPMRASRPLHSAALHCSPPRCLQLHASPPRARRLGNHFVVIVILQPLAAHCPPPSPELCGCDVGSAVVLVLVTSVLGAELAAVGFAAVVIVLHSQEAGREQQSARPDPQQVSSKRPSLCARPCRIRLENRAGW